MFRRGTALLLGVTALGLVPTTPTALAQVECADGLNAGGEYFPVAPTRIYDQAGINADGSVDVDVVGRFGVPAENVLAAGAEALRFDLRQRGWSGRDEPERCHAQEKGCASSEHRCRDHDRGL